VATELCVESLKEGRNRGFHPSLREFPLKSSLSRPVLELLLKVAETWIFLSTQEFLREFKDLKHGFPMEPSALNLGSTYSRLALADTL